MCGIVGITSTKNVSSSILNSLRKLEYRGYDSAGIATLEGGFIKEVKCEGRVDSLENNLSKHKIDGTVGIGHVRWATHGVPSTVNAHPHSSDKVSVVHNGIIENSTILKKLLIKKGYVFFTNGDWNLNLIGIRGESRVANSFDDTLLLISSSTGIFSFSLSSWFGSSTCRVNTS